MSFISITYSQTFLHGQRCFFREKYLMVILRFNEDNTHDECCIDVVLKAGRYHEEQPCHVDGKHSEQEPGWNADGAVVSLGTWTWTRGT